MLPPLKLAVCAAGAWSVQAVGTNGMLMATNFTFASKRGSHLTQDHFDDYMRQKGRGYSKGSMEYDKRFALFLQRSEMVEQVNSHPDKTWKATLNHFADRTELELQRMLGYKKNHRRAMASAVALRIKASFGEEYPERASVNWSHDLSSLALIRDQEDCGSCWAVTATTVLDAHAERSGRSQFFSTQQVVDCVPNPSKCGGTGGCDGATVELAFQYALLKGLDSPETYGAYTAKQGVCSWQADAQTSPSLFELTSLGAGALTMEAPANAAGLAYGMSGWARLEANSYRELIKEVTEQGPVAIALAASTDLFFYSSGIFSDCDWIVNHAVTLIGYGSEGNDKYWLIQNSWGSQWGEEGRARIARQAASKEANHCGMDTEPQQGIACEGETEAVAVCGTCGVLYDSVIPRFIM